MTLSPSLKASRKPVATASCPIYTWRKARIRAIRRYKSTRRSELVAMAPPPSRVSTPPSSECSLSADINGPFPLRGTNLRTEYQNRVFRTHFHTLLYPAPSFSQPLPHSPEGPRPVGVFVLAFAHLGVGHRRPFGYEHGIVAEPTGTSRPLRQSSRHFTPEGEHVAVSLR